MAVHAICEFCGHKLSVPDKLKGKKLSCPSCKKKTRVLTPLDLSVEEARMKKKQEKTTGKHAKEPEEGKSQAGDSVEQADKKIAASVRLTKYPALRTLRLVFVFFAYLVAILGVALGIVLYMRTGSREGLVLLLSLFVGSVISFCLFKILAEFARLGADMGDMESRMVEILLDLRDKLDRLKQ